MEIKTKIKNDKLVMNLYGDIDFYNSAVLKNIISSKIHQKNVHITINMSDVNHIDSQASDMLRTYFCTAKQRHHHLTIIQPAEVIL